VDDGSADLVLHEVIGQGGFGVVYRCGWLVQVLFLQLFLCSV
jgi:hypothetical protein